MRFTPPPPLAAGIAERTIPECRIQHTRARYTWRLSWPVVGSGVWQVGVLLLYMPGMLGSGRGRGAYAGWFLAAFTMEKVGFFAYIVVAAGWVSPYSIRHGGAVRGEGVQETRLMRGVSPASLLPVQCRRRLRGQPASPPRRRSVRIKQSSGGGD
jgi:hypothetical protein